MRYSVYAILPMQSARNALRQSAFGENCVIGAGSVVTRDIPANSFAAGVPAGVIRPITQKDAIANLFDDLH